MIVGILSVVVIVLTQSFYDSTETAQKKVKTEQTADQNASEVTTISAPSDLVPHGNAVAIHHTPYGMLEQIAPVEKKKNASVVIKKTFVSFFKITALRDYVISSDTCMTHYRALSKTLQQQ